MSNCTNCGNFNGVRCQLLGTCPYPEFTPLNFTGLTVGKGTPIKFTPLTDKGIDMLDRITKLEETVRVLQECVDALLAGKLKQSMTKSEAKQGEHVVPVTMIPPGYPITFGIPRGLTEGTGEVKGLPPNTK